MRSHHQRSFLHLLDLLLQHQHLAAPVVGRAEPRKVDRKNRVFPTPGQPSAVVDQPQRAQGLDELKLYFALPIKLNYLN